MIRQANAANPRQPNQGKAGLTNEHQGKTRQKRASENKASEGKLKPRQAKAWKRSQDRYDISWHSILKHHKGLILAMSWL
jgi:hypothetical protein